MKVRCGGAISPEVWGNVRRSNGEGAQMWGGSYEVYWAKVGKCGVSSLQEWVRSSGGWVRYRRQMERLCGGNGRSSVEDIRSSVEGDGTVRA